MSIDDKAIGHDGFTVFSNNDTGKMVRWIIEVFNKKAKGLLNLGGCQSSNFDAQIADATISMIAYILL